MTRAPVLFTGLETVYSRDTAPPAVLVTVVAVAGEIDENAVAGAPSAALRPATVKVTGTPAEATPAILVMPDTRNLTPLTAGTAVESSAVEPAVAVPTTAEAMPRSVIVAEADRVTGSVPVTWLTGLAKAAVMPPVPAEALHVSAPA